MFAVAVAIVEPLNYRGVASYLGCGSFPENGWIE